MRAVSQDRSGGPEVLHVVDVETPKPGATEVLVRVHAAGVNATDWKTRQRGSFANGAEPPFVLGFDVSGVVQEVGLGVAILEPGDEVFGMLMFPAPAGCYAEYVRAPARQFARKPSGVTHIEAAALPLAALTAWQALVDVAQVRAGQRVLIHGAAGGVGHLAVQIAASRGAHVIGTATQPKHQLLHKLGASELVDYTQQDFVEAVHDVDVVLDTIGGDYTARSLRTLRGGGILVSLLPAQPDFPDELATQLGVRAKRMLVEPDHAGMQSIADMVDRNELHVEIDSIYPLAEAARAHERGETNAATGKIVLSVVDPNG